MTDRKVLYAGASCAAWGYFFLYFDLNLGTVSVLPSFVGCLLFLSAIKHLSAERRDLALLRPLGILLALWHGADWLFSCLGTSLDGRFLPLDLVIAAASLYFHFQLFTDLSAIAAAYQQPGSTLDRRFLCWRTVQALLTTARALVLSLPEGDVLNWTALAIMLIGCIVALCLMIEVFALRRLFREDVPAS